MCTLVAVLVNSLGMPNFSPCTRDVDMHLVRSLCLSTHAAWSSVCIVVSGFSFWLRVAGCLAILFFAQSQFFLCPYIL